MERAPRRREESRGGWMPWQGLGPTMECRMKVQRVERCGCGEALASCLRDRRLWLCTFRASR